MQFFALKVGVVLALVSLVSFRGKGVPAGVGYLYTYIHIYIYLQEYLYLDLLLRGHLLFPSLLLAASGHKGFILRFHQSEVKATSQKWEVVKILVPFLGP